MQILHNKVLKEYNKLVCYTFKQLKNYISLISLDNNSLTFQDIFPVLKKSIGKLYDLRNYDVHLIMIAVLAVKNKLEHTFYMAVLQTFITKYFGLIQTKFRFSNELQVQLS